MLTCDRQTTTSSRGCHSDTNIAHRCYRCYLPNRNPFCTVRHFQPSSPYEQLSDVGILSHQLKSERGLVMPSSICTGYKHYNNPATSNLDISGIGVLAVYPVSVWKPGPEYPTPADATRRRPFRAGQWHGISHSNGLRQTRSATWTGPQSGKTRCC